MSAYAEAPTTFKNRELLLKALSENGYPIVEVNETAQRLIDWHGNPQLIPNTHEYRTAEIIIRRAEIGGLSNDIGFKWNPITGSYDAIISQYDSRQHNAQWLTAVKTSYREAFTIREASRQGARFTGRKMVNGKIQLQFVQAGR